MAEHLVDGDVGVTTLLRAALPAIPGLNLLPGIRKSGSDDLAELSFRRRPTELRRQHVAAYAEVCGFPAKDTVPVTYPHVLGFPLHLSVMSEPAFPFPAMGAVHLANTITAHRPIAIGETVDVEVHPEDLRPHPRGRLVDLVTELTVDGQPVWEGRSTYLRRGAGDPDAPRGPSLDDVPPSGVTWNLGGDLGRRYAAVSGDRNPIHLYPLTAKALGFRRQIAHGMWTAARCVAALENRLPDALTVEVTFKKPVFLPVAVAFGARRDATGYAFGLTDPRSGVTHLQGRTTHA